MKTVLQFKWESYGRAIFLTQAIMYLVFTLVFSVDMILFADEDVEQSLQQVYLNSGVGKFRIFLELVIGIYLVYYILVIPPQIFTFRMNFGSSLKKGDPI